MLRNTRKRHFRRGLHTLLAALAATVVVLQPLVALGDEPAVAHVGVIQWFEEHRIPIDLIAGTSMGGLVGGIYATGADTEAMKELIAQIDWPLVLSTDTPYPQKAFRRKEDARAAPMAFEWGLRDGFKLPPGLDAGHQVGLVLDRIAFPYSAIDSFDQLPTPFACVAVDLESGDAVVFRDGGLGEALRSTMSYPGWFSPVRSGDRVMIDGGVLNNLPTDVMLEMGADIVIAVDLGMRAAEEEPFDNVVGVLNRTLSVMMRHNTNRSVELADMLITPDVSGFSFTDFDRAEDLEKIGYDATAEIGADIAGYTLDEVAWQEYLAAREERRRPFQATPEFLDVSGAVAVDDRVVHDTLDHHLGAELDADRLDRDLTNITGWGRYDVAGYTGAERDGMEGLDIGVTQKTYGPPFVRPILDLRGGEFGEALITFGGRFTFFDVAGDNSEWRTDATYGQKTQVFSELFIPLGAGGWFVAPRGVAGLNKELVYFEGEAVAEFEVGRGGGGADIGYLFGPRSQLRFGFDVQYQTAETKVGEPLIESLEGGAGAVRALWSFDGANHPIIPTRGVRITSEARWVYESPDFSDELLRTVSDAPDAEFYQARLSIVGARHLSRRFSFLGSVEGGTSFSSTATPLEQFLIGGPLRLGAMGVGELRGSHYYLGRAGVLWALADENSLSFFGKFYLATFYEIGDAFESKSEPFHDVTFGLAGETILGGVFAGGAVGEDGRAGFFFAIGRLF